MKILGTTSLLLFSIFLKQAACSDLPAGKIVWWGMMRVSSNMGPRDHTNGVIELGNQIVSNAVSIAEGTMEGGMAVRSDGTVFSFGRRDSPGGSDVLPGLSNVASIVDSRLAIKRDGTVASLGDDLGDANIVSSLSNVTAMAGVDGRSYLALQKDGTVLGIRFDSARDVMVDPAAGYQTILDPTTGLPTPNQSPVPSPVRPVRVCGQSLSNAAGLTLMGDFPRVPLVLMSNGTVFGLNPIGMDPNGGLLKRPYDYAAMDPIRVGGQALSNVVAIASGGGHCLALKHNGTVVAWGDNHYGETDVPTNLNNVVAIAAAQNLSLALKRDGTVVAWGGNDSGQTAVPSGLSNVIAIAAGWPFALAITTGSVPAGVFIPPHGRLEEMAWAADLVFKGRVLSTSAVTNAAFPEWGKPFETRLEVISVLKGNKDTSVVRFQHNTEGPQGWSGGTPPGHHIFGAGQSYIVFAAKADRPDYLYSPSSNRIASPDQFRQIMRGEFALRTLDARPLDTLPIKAAGWLELNGLLTSGVPSNSLYAIQNLNLMNKGCLAPWGHSEDFKREAVLTAVSPFVTNANDEVAIAAIGCFLIGGSYGTFVGDQGGWVPIVRGCSEVPPECAVQVSPYAAALVGVATQSSSVARRVAAIAALSCTRFTIVSNSLPQWLGDASDQVRAQATLLLPDFPGEFAEPLLRERSTDASPKVRSAVADAIGNGKLVQLLPTLVKLWSEPVGPTNPIAPLTMEELQSGERLMCENVGDVHTSAGYALLKFGVDQVSDILKTNLNDPGFRLNFLCKLAEKEVEPWLQDMTEAMEARRTRMQNKVEAGVVEPKADFFGASMTLSGTYFRCWNIIYNHLRGLPKDAFANGKLNRYLDVLENAGKTGSQEPEKIYDLYRRNDLTERATEYRSHCEKTFGYDIGYYFKRVDAQFTNAPANSRQ